MTFLPRVHFHKAGASFLAVLLAPLAGCDIFTRIEAVHRDNVDLRDQLQTAQTELAARQERLDAMNQRVEALQGRGDLDLAKLPHATRIRFASLTGGHDYDGQLGDDGITVYVQPLDADGHVIKATGSLRIQLFDLAQTTGNPEFASYQLDTEQTRATWRDGLMTKHYTVKCPWPDDRIPDHREITVRASFTDYLSGAVLTAQGAFPITFPPDRQAASQ